MFLIGLELNPAKLWELRRAIFGVGSMQVVLTASIFQGSFSFYFFFMAGCRYWWIRYCDVFYGDGIATYE